jgi:hypothetical protein
MCNLKGLNMKIKRDPNSVSSLVEERLEQLEEQKCLAQRKIDILMNVFDLFKEGKITEEETELITAFDGRYKTQTKPSRMIEIHRILDAN